MGFATPLVGAALGLIGTVGGTVSGAVGMAGGLGTIGGLFSAMSAASSLFGGKPKTPSIPTPAPPVAAPRATGGADVQIGTDSRISGTSPRFQQLQSKSTDVLAGLGRGGLSL